jgi:hypothetical protein
MNIYQSESHICIKRLFALLDRNPLSPTYGCFHRCFWLHKLSDFPSASRQQGVLALAQYWKYDARYNLDRKEVLDLIEASILYTCKIQNNDGSFDEWYPNERGWAGPTGYLIHSLATAYEICGDALSKETVSKLKETLSKGALFLGRGWEQHVLFNHVAMALLPLYQVFKITNDQIIENYFESLFVRFKKYYDFSEGWGLEYDGADIGYQSATVSFLSRIHERMGSCSIKDDIEEICESSLHFIEHFCFPDGRFSAKIGSRETDVLFPYGIEYWANRGSDCAKAMAHFVRKSLSVGILLTPKDHEDHYFIYRLPEFLECGNVFQLHDSCKYLLPFEKQYYERDFKSAGILCLKKDNFYTAINFNRGGVLLRYDCLEKKATHINRGVLLDHEGVIFSSSQVCRNTVERLSNEEFIIKGNFVKFSPKAFSFLTFFLFRLACKTLAWNQYGAYWIKAFVRYLLLKLGRKSQFTFERHINLGEKDIIKDFSPVFSKDNHLSGEFDIRYVPQSRYFHHDDLKFFPRAKSS